MRRPGRHSRGGWSGRRRRVGCGLWQWDRRVRRLRSVRWLRRGRRIWSRSGCRIGCGGWVRSRGGQWHKRVCWLGSVRWLRRGRWVGRRHGGACRVSRRRRQRSGRGYGRIGRIGRVSRLGCESRHRRIQLYGGWTVVSAGRFGSTQSGEHAGRRRGGCRNFGRIAATHYHQHHQCAGCNSQNRSGHPAFRL